MDGEERSVLAERRVSLESLSFLFLIQSEHTYRAMFLGLIKHHALELNPTIDREQSTVHVLMCRAKRSIEYGEGLNNKNELLLGVGTNMTSYILFTCMLDFESLARIHRGLLIMASELKCLGMKCVRSLILNQTQNDSYHHLENYTLQAD
jgi:hypothetical protein